MCYGGYTSKRIHHNVEMLSLRLVVLQVEEILQLLRECGMLRIKDDSLAADQQLKASARLSLPLQATHVLAISRLGRAAVKGNF